MQVKTFFPVIHTRKPEDAIAFFEAIGFKVAHKSNDESGSPNNVQLKDEAGHIVEVTKIGDAFNKEEDTMMIHINIEDLEEDKKFMESKGFKNIYHDEHPSAKYLTFEAPTGFKIDLCKHIKKN